MSSASLPRTIDVAIAVIHRDRSILICQRPADTTFAGLWEFPGGKREVGESLHACLHRELREELALSVRIERPLTMIAHRYPHAHVHLHPFVCAWTEGEPQALQCQATRWIDPTQLRDYAFPPANETLLDEVQRLFTPLR